MPFSDLEETIDDLNFEHGFYKGVFIAEERWGFLSKVRDIKDFKTRLFKEEYNILFNQPHKRR